jgi:hypothetical protein
MGSMKNGGIYKVYQNHTCPKRKYSVEVCDSNYLNGNSLVSDPGYLISISLDHSLFIFSFNYLLKTKLLLVLLRQRVSVSNVAILQQEILSTHACDYFW